MITDSHTHSIYSFDGHDSPRRMCEAAEAAGVSSFVITDHYDIDGVLDRLYPDYDEDAARRDIDAAQAEFAGRVQVYRGIELGQAGLRPAEAKEFLTRNRFDFVICSCHNLAGVPDFYFIDFREMTQELMESLYRRMLEELCLHAAVGGMHTVAHLSYPLRYMAKGGRRVDVKIYEAQYRKLFHIMRENGMAAELNTKALRLGLIPAETERYILRLWRDCGGRDVTVGSDAHRAEELGLGIADGYVLLRECGFDRIAFPSCGGIASINIV